MVTSEEVPYFLTVSLCAFSIVVCVQGNYQGIEKPFQRTIALDGSQLSEASILTVLPSANVSFPLGSGVCISWLLEGIKTFYPLN